MKQNKFWIILSLACLVYTANFWGTSIYILDEAKNAACAMEMLHSNNLIVPTFNGELRTDKPPLHYYCMIMAYKVFGINSFAARLFSVIAGILTVMITFYFVKKFLNESVAFYTALIMVSALQLVIQFHLAVPDPYLILFLTLSFFLFYDGFQFDNKKSMLCFYITVGFAFLSKGLIAIVFPVIIIPLFLFMQHQLNIQGIRKLRLPLGIVLFLLVAIPWYAAVGYYTQGAWLEGFFLKHNLDRFTSTMEGHKGFFMAPFAIVIIALLPFSMFIIQAVAHAWTKRIQQPFISLCLLISFVIPGFFSFSKTILPSYPAPALPFIAILLGYFISEYFLADVNAKSKKGIYVSLIIYGIIMICVPVLIYYAIDQEISLHLLKPVSFLFIILPVAALLSIYFYYRKMPVMSIYTLSASWMLTGLLFFYYCYPKLDEQNPVIQSQSIFIKHPRAVAYYGSFNPAYVFAFQSNIKELLTPEEVVNYFNTQDGYLITYKKHLKKFKDMPSLEIIFSRKDLFETKETVILTRKK